MKKIVIVGTSGHAKVIIDIIEQQKVYSIFGLIDSFKKKDDKVYNYSILGTEKNIPYLVEKEGVYGGFIAIGDNFTRMKLYHEISSYDIDFKFISAIHPNASIGKNVKINSGTCIMGGSVVNSDAKIGKQCIINTKSSVGHDVKIKDFSSISPGVTLGGATIVGKCTAISIGATVIEGIEIGKHSVIGACSMVNKDIGDNKLAFGIPAKEINNRNSNDKYLGIKKVKKEKHYSLKFYTINCKKSKKKYLAFLQELDSNNIFYSLEYSNNYKKQTYSYFVLKYQGIAKIIMPISLIKISSKENIPLSKTYYDAVSPYGYSGPLCENASNKDLKVFWKKVDKWYSKNNVVTEFIRFNLNNNYINYSGYLIPSLKNVKGELKSFEYVWNNLKQKVRNNYRRATKNNLKAVFHYNSIGESAINHFHTIYTKTMERNDASKNYYYPKIYFEELTQNNPKSTVLVIVYKEDIPISTELIVIVNDTMYSHLGGTLSDYFDLRPNDFLKIEAIKWAIQKDIKYYALGGGRKDHDGLYNYKKSFFPKDKDMVYHTGRKVVNKEIYNKLTGNITPECTEIDDSLITNPLSFFPAYNKK